MWLYEQLSPPLLPPPVNNFRKIGIVLRCLFNSSHLLASDKYSSHHGHGNEPANIAARHYIFAIRLDSVPAGKLCKGITTTFPLSLSIYLANRFASKPENYAKWLLQIYNPVRKHMIRSRQGNSLIETVEKTISMDC